MKVEQGMGFIRAQGTNVFIKNSLKKSKLKNKMVSMKVHKRREQNYKEPIKACRKKTGIVGHVSYFIQKGQEWL